MPQVKRKKSILSGPKGGLSKRQAGQNGAVSATKPKKQRSGAKAPGGGSGGSSGGSGATRPTAAAAAADPPAADRRASHAAAGPRSNGGGEWHCRSVIDRQAAAAVSRLLAAAETRSRGATIKSLTLAPHVVHKKPTFAVTCQTLKHLPLLKQLLAAVGLPDACPQLSPAAAYVLAYEALFGQGMRERGPAEKAVMGRREEMRAALRRLLGDAGVEGVEQWLEQQQAADGGGGAAAPAAPHPRWARVNTLRLSVEDALSRLRADKATAQAEVDDLLPDVVRLPPGTDLHDHPMVQSGELILQSKASCLPARGLNPAPGWTVLDACAAPGNKTTHAAALVGPSGRVLAFDRDPKRLARLRGNAQRAGADRIIAAECADFLTLDPSDARFARVRGIILDPSCSGSGTGVSRMDHLLPGVGRGGGGGGGGEDAGEADAAEAARVEQLAKFQEAALRHALAFPGLLRLAYSTCSVYRRENEDVVASVLPDARRRGFDLVDPFPGGAWRRRGLPGSVPGGREALVVRTDPAEDGTDGFFLAVFERAAAGAGGGGDGGPAAAPAERQVESGAAASKKASKSKKQRCAV